ncbi:unnamed protein product [Schistosoma turkestanicum]|nr:unnamed protein product [Schistosoma turkestanicum]
MSLNDVILDHESNQCLFVCTKCGAEYVTRDMLAMHMMDSARTGMCTETDATGNVVSVNNNTNHKITRCEDLIDSDKLIAQKSDEISNIFDPSLYRSSLSSWIGERTEPIFNLLFNQLTLPNLYSMQNSTVNNINNNNNNDLNSLQINSTNRSKFLSAYEGNTNITSLKECRLNPGDTSSIIDMQNHESLHSLLLNSQYPTNSISPNIKMNFIQSLKINKNDILSKSAVKDNIRMINEKSIPNDHKLKSKSVSNEVVTSQTSASSIYSFIKTLTGYNAITTSNRDTNESLNISTGTQLTNENKKFIDNAQCKSQRENQQSLKIAVLDSKVKCIESHKVAKCNELVDNIKRYKIDDHHFKIKRSRSLPSPRELRNQQHNFELNYSILEGNNKILKTNHMNNSDGVLHKVK